jgi:hypothetical protein
MTYFAIEHVPLISVFGILRCTANTFMKRKVFFAAATAYAFQSPHNRMTQQFKVWVWAYRRERGTATEEQQQRKKQRKQQRNSQRKDHSAEGLQEQPFVGLHATRINLWQRRGMVGTLSVPCATRTTLAQRATFSNLSSGLDTNQ